MELKASFQSVELIEKVVFLTVRLAYLTEKKFQVLIKFGFLPLLCLRTCSQRRMTVI